MIFQHDFTLLFISSSGGRILVMTGRFELGNPMDLAPGSEGVV